MNTPFAMTDVIHTLLEEFVIEFGIMPTRIELSLPAYQALQWQFARDSSDNTLIDEYRNNGLVGQWEGIPLYVKLLTTDFLKAFAPDA